ncbi:MAG: GntR family transcriptional regulator, partial [Solirubrobacteraceae bacterium]
MAALEPPRRRTAADEAELALYRGIMDGAIGPGTQLRLQDLADQLGMSMMPIREALRRLQSVGLVEIVAHKGAWVRPLTRPDLFDTYFTRMHLEGIALANAVGRFGAAEAQAARAALAEQHAAHERQDLIGARDAHERFHFTLYEASGSEWLVRSIWPLWRNAERYRVESMRNAEHVRRRAAEHVAMLEALEEGDGAAAVKLLYEHLRTSVELVAASVETEEGAHVMELPTVEGVLASSKGAGRHLTERGADSRVRTQTDSL